MLYTAHLAAAQINKSDIDGLTYEDANGNKPDKEGCPDFIHSIKQQKLSSCQWKKELQK